MARAVLKCASVSPGIAIGPMRLLRDALLYERKNIEPGEVAAEIAALNAASESVGRELELTMRNIPENMAEWGEIIGAQIELARDPKILEGARARIRRRRICAAWALAETIEELCSLFGGMADPYLRDRARDIKVIGQSMAERLYGRKKSMETDADAIIGAYDLSPADVMDLKLNGIQGIVMIEGGPTSHAAILARGLKVPAVVGARELFEEARESETVIVDGLAGKVLLGPDDNDLAIYKYRRDSYELFERGAGESASLPAVTRDGATIRVRANLENQGEISGLAKSGAEGIGLYRTEFAWLGEKLPDEEDLVEEYAAIIASANSGPVVFRTLDVGADKLPAIHDDLREQNPALGLRGIRFCLRHKDLFRMQLRAILRASHHADAAIMLPMVATLQEVRETRAILEATCQELRSLNLPHAEKLPLGVMIETPAAVLISDALAAHCDFLSLGTNDLLHYLMAIDRNNRHVSYLHDPLHPAFTRSLKRVIDAARERNIPVSVCGELAADPVGVALLIGLGVNILSVTPRFAPAIKGIVRQLDTAICANLANAALAEMNTAKTRSMLLETLQSRIGPALSFQNSLISHDGPRNE